MKKEAILKQYFGGKSIWITGASSGIGRSIALRLGELGARLILSARNVERLAEIAGRLPGDSARVLPLDVSDIDSLSAKADEALSFFGGIDMLFNNAGISQRSYLHETSFDVIRRILDVDFTGPAALTTYLLPHMYERGSGHIIATSSVMGKFGTPLRTGYCAAKHALQGFYESLYVEAKNRGVAVTLLAPGWIRTDISFNALSGDGSLHGVLDPGMTKAAGPDAYVDRMLLKIAKRRFEYIFALSWKSRFGLVFKRFAPGILHYALTKIGVT